MPYKYDLHRAALLLAVLLTLLFAGCENKQTPTAQKAKLFTHYTEIPGVTEEEIQMVEAFRARAKPFIYGMPLNSEMFYNADGKLSGYTPLVCSWLSTLFNHTFEPTPFKWHELLRGLEANTIDFTGELTPSEAKRKAYFMTDAIIAREVKCLRIAGSKPLPEIALQRLPRYVFMQDSIVYSIITPYLTEEYEPVFADSRNAAYKLLKSGEADVIFDDDANEVELMTQYNDIESSDFSPLTYAHVSFSTQNPELAAFVSIVQKALKNGGAQHLMELRDTGTRAYKHNSLWKRLTEEEKTYIDKHGVSGRPVPFVATYDGYPIAFYNSEEKSWQGIAFDVLQDISFLTGLAFERINAEHEKWPEILAKLKNGEASLIMNLIPTRERKNHFIWADIPFTVDKYALLSRDEFHDINDDEILHLKIGLIKDTAYTEWFRTRFPDHPNTVEFDGTYEAIEALGQGNIDLMMSTQNLLLTLTHFMEQPDYKANFVFAQTCKSILGFNKNETLLASIINKALYLVDTKNISERWLHKTFNYREKMVSAQRPWLLGVCALLFCMLVQAVFLLNAHKKRNKQSLARLSALVEASPQFELYMTPVGQIEYINKAGSDISGYNRKEIVRDGLSIMLDERNTQRFYKEYLPDVAQGKRFNTEIAIVRKDGEKRVLACAIFPVIQDNVHLSVCVTGHDVTELRNVQNELLQAKVKAENALKIEEQFSKARSNFFSVISHEIRTPLNAILGMVNILRHDEEQKKEALLDTIDQASHELLDIFDSIINLTQLQSGSFSLNNKAFDLHRALNGLIVIARAHTEKKRQVLTVHRGQNMPARVVGDVTKLLLVLKRLIGNAIKFTPEGGAITISSRTAHETETSWSFCFEISDTGIGMSQKVQEKLWQPCVGCTTITRTHGGMGLGLALARQIARKMDGDINFESVAGEGSTFFCTVTLGKPTAHANNAATAESKAPIVNIAEILHGKRILIADDVELNRMILETNLRVADVTIENASDGYEAVEKFCQSGGAYDLVLMDLHMPEMDGYEAAQHIRACDLANSATVPIIAVTADTGAEKAVYEARMNGLVLKPVNRDMLLETVAQQFITRD